MKQDEPKRGIARRCGSLWCLALVFLVPGLLLASDEFQYWAEGNISARLAKHVKAKIGTQSRLDEHGSLTYEHLDMGLAYTGLADWLDLGLNYKVVFRQTSEDAWKRETRPHLNATARFTLFGLVFSDRSLQCPSAGRAPAPHVH